MTLTSPAPFILFGKYTATNRIGTTGLATVYRAQDAAGNPVAVKVLLGYFAQDPSMAQRFLPVMAKAQALQHPNIVRVVGVEHGADGTAVVMEYVTWPTLKARRSPTLPVGEALHILRQAALALDFAHQQGIVHRDVRPSNVFYDPDTGQVKVSDFGTIALVEGGYALVRTTVNTPHPSFVAPEQTQGQPPDARNDVYSLAAVAYELLTNEIPYDALNPYTILSRQLTTTPEPPSRIEKTLSREIDDVLLKALHRRVEQRYATCGEFVQALEQAAGQQALAPVYKAAATGAASAVTAQPIAPQPDVEDGARVVCPHCGAGNAAAALRCQNCWLPLSGQQVVSAEEARLQTSRYLSGLRRHNRSVKLVLAAGALALLAAWAFVLVEVRPPLPKPSTLLSATSPEGQWTMPGWDPLHTSAVPGPAFAPTGEALWSFVSEGPILSAPAVDGQRVYVATSDKRVAALDKTSGSVVWTYDTSGPVNAALVRAGEFLYAGLRDGNIVALDAVTGIERWRFHTGGALYASFAIVDGALYAGSADSHVYSLDAQTGKLRWQRELEDWVMATPVVVDGIVIVGSRDGEFYLLDASNGTLRNQVNLGTAIDTTPVVVGDIAYVSTRGERIIAFNYHQKDTPFQKAVWSIWLNVWVWNMAPAPPGIPGMVWTVSLKRRQQVMSDMSTDGKRMFVGTDDGQLRALDVATGEEAWKITGPSKIKTTPLISGDSLIVASGDNRTPGDGDITAYDAATGAERWRRHIGEEITTPPILAGGVLYIGTEQGKLYAIR
ncbi:MAG: PQQ-binding-like beta-propeller repeat protein [Chloroflexi bacterium]|nr:PQQ-binding-like beta-propeller repeat protein [Chloroflexota bacterium]